jgi:hypothetical protein
VERRWPGAPLTAEARAWLAEARKIAEAAEAAIDAVRTGRVTLNVAVTASENWMRDLSDSLLDAAARARNPAASLASRARVLAETAAVAAADAADSELDPRRADTELQQQIAALLEAAGLAEVPAAEGDAFDPGLHHPLDATPARGRYAPQTIARVAARALREPNGQLLRKARVILYR